MAGACHCGCRPLPVVRIAAGDHNMEVVPPLTTVASGVRAEVGSPKSTLDVCGRCWIGAGRGWPKTGISLEVDVEAPAAIGAVTEAGTSGRVVGSESLIRQIAHAWLRRSLQVLEAKLVAIRSACALCCSREVGVCQESTVGV